MREREDIDVYINGIPSGFDKIKELMNEAKKGVNVKLQLDSALSKKEFMEFRKEAERITDIFTKASNANAFVSQKQALKEMIQMMQVIEAKQGQLLDQKRIFPKGKADGLRAMIDDERKALRMAYDRLEKEYTQQSGLFFEKIQRRLRMNSLPHFGFGAEPSGGTSRYANQRGSIYKPSSKEDPYSFSGGGAAYVSKMQKQIDKGIIAPEQAAANWQDRFLRSIGNKEAYAKLMNNFEKDYGKYIQTTSRTGEGTSYRPSQQERLAREKQIISDAKKNLVDNNLIPSLMRGQFGKAFGLLGNLFKEDYSNFYKTGTLRFGNKRIFRDSETGDSFTVPITRISRQKAIDSKAKGYRDAAEINTAVESIGKSLTNLSRTLGAAQPKNTLGGLPLMEAATSPTAFRLGKNSRFNDEVQRIEPDEGVSFGRRSLGAVPQAYPLNQATQARVDLARETYNRILANKMVLHENPDNYGGVANLRAAAESLHGVAPTVSPGRGFDLRRINNPGSLLQSVIALQQGPLPFIGSVLGSATKYGAEGGLIGTAVGTMLSGLLDKFADSVHKIFEPGLTFNRSILGLAAINQQNSQFVSSSTGKALPIGDQIALQQSKALRIQLSARSKLLPLGIAGQRETTFVQGISSALSQRGFNVTEEQVGQIAELLGGTIQAQRPQLLDNPTLLLRDLQDVLGGGPSATRVLLTQLIGRNTAAGIQKAKNTEDIVKNLKAAGLGAQSEALKNSDNIQTSINKLLGAFDQFVTKGGVKFIDQFSESFKNLSDTLTADAESGGPITQAVEGLSEAMGLFVDTIIQAILYLGELTIKFGEFLGTLTPGKVLEPGIQGGLSAALSSNPLGRILDFTTGGALSKGISELKLASPIDRAFNNSGIGKAIDFFGDLALKRQYQSILKRRKLEKLEAGSESGQTVQAIFNQAFTSAGVNAEDRSRLSAEATDTPELLLARLLEQRSSLLEKAKTRPEIFTHPDYQLFTKAVANAKQKASLEREDLYGGSSGLAGIFSAKESLLRAQSEKQSIQENTDALSVRQGRVTQDALANVEAQATALKANLEKGEPAIAELERRKKDLETSLTRRFLTTKEPEVRFDKQQNELFTFMATKRKSIAEGKKEGLIPVESLTILEDLDEKIVKAKKAQKEEQENLNKLLKNSSELEKQSATIQEGINKDELLYAKQSTEADFKIYKKKIGLIDAQTASATGLNLGLTNRDKTDISFRTSFVAVQKKDLATKRLLEIEALKANPNTDKDLLAKRVAETLKILDDRLAAEKALIQEEMNRAALEKERAELDSTTKTAYKDLQDAMFNELTTRKKLNMTLQSSVNALQEFNNQARLRELGRIEGAIGLGEQAAGIANNSAILGNLPSEALAALQSPSFAADLKRQQLEEQAAAAGRDFANAPLTEQEQQAKLQEAVDNNRSSLDKLTSSIDELRKTYETAKTAQEEADKSTSIPIDFEAFKETTPGSLGAEVDTAFASAKDRIAGKLKGKGSIMGKFDPEKMYQKANDEIPDIFNPKESSKFTLPESSDAAYKPYNALYREPSISDISYGALAGGGLGGSMDDDGVVNELTNAINNGTESQADALLKAGSLVGPVMAASALSGSGFGSGVNMGATFENQDMYKDSQSTWKITRPGMLEPKYDTSTFLKGGVEANETMFDTYGPYPGPTPKSGAEAAAQFLAGSFGPDGVAASALVAAKDEGPMVAGSATKSSSGIGKKTNEPFIKGVKDVVAPIIKDKEDSKASGDASLEKVVELLKSIEKSLGESNAKALEESFYNAMQREFK